MTSLPSFASPDQGIDRPETCRAGPPIYGGNGELLSPRLVALGSGLGLGMEGELVSPLLMAPVHIDPSCLHPDLLTEVQHVVIAREQLLLHLNQVIGRGQFQFHNHQNSSSTCVYAVFAATQTLSVFGKQTILAAILITWSNYGFRLFFSGGEKKRELFPGGTDSC